jgi:hypothetical protein
VCKHTVSLPCVVTLSLSKGLCVGLSTINYNFSIE